MLKDILYSKTVCNTCAKPYNKPFRIYDKNGKIVSGCVDACHTGMLVPLSDSAFWHNRPESKAVRKNLEKLKKA